MNSFLRQSTASQSRAIGSFVDDTDFKTTETGLTIANTDIKLIVNGAASANKNSGGGTHRANGVYGVTFDATDTATVGEMFVSVVVSGALPVFATFVVLEEAVYDALFAASAPGYLQPTTAGRTLDVTATGEAGIDWANIGGPTTTQNLSGTTIKTATDVEADTQDIQARLPAALVSGRIDASVGAVAAGAITAASIATGAIDADAIATDAVTEIQAGLATAVEVAKIPKSDGTSTWNATALASLQQEATDALNAYDPPTHAELITALAAADDAVLAAIAALNNISTAQVNAEVVDALNVDTYAEPGGVPAATASLVSKIGRLHQVLRNKLTVTAAAKTLYDDSGALLWQKTLSDDGTTFTENEGVIA